MPTQTSATPFSPPSHAPPGASTSPAATGHVILYDALKCEAVNVVEAHKSPLSSLALNSEGTLLATASDKGTIIRVFSVPDAQKLYQFRRGTYPSRIFSMSFNLVSSLLCVSSATETVHIFRLGAPKDETNSGGSTALGPSGTPISSSSMSPPLDIKGGYRRRSISPSSAGSSPSNHAGASKEGFDALVDSKKRNGTLGSMIRRSSQTIGRTMAGAVGGYLPSAMTEMWEPARDFAYVKLPSAGVKSVVALSGTCPQIMVVTSEGYFYAYNVDMEKGGECILINKYR